MILYIEHPSPLGTMLLAASEAGLCGVYFEPHSHFVGPAGWQKVGAADLRPDEGDGQSEARPRDPVAGAAPAEAAATAGVGSAQAGSASARSLRQHAILRETALQLDQYFARERRTFDLPLAPQGTPFQCEVWQGLRRIPFGETWHYAQLAHEIARPRAVRAVGAANGRNPLSIIVPCHRVIGRDGTLVGYAGGLERKQFLLALEHDEQGGLF